MAGPISEMKRVYNYVAPTSPHELMDCSHFTIDFENRIFLNVGFDPKDQFNIIVKIITPSRYVNISSEFLKRIYSVMGHVLSHVLDPVVKYKKIIFLEDKVALLTSMVYKGEHVLVIESKTTNGCRIILSRRDLMTIQDLECAIFETISRKNDIVKPIILNQLEQISEYINTDFNIDKSVTLEEVKTIIKGIHIELIAKHVPKHKHSFISQIKLFATEQLAINWMTKNLPKAVGENDDDDDELIKFLSAYPEDA
ncbi:uncharacterized protein LOC107885910 [Acyrthosiphon pisum]|uniref:Uncharacterized protein n=1 Tax=Acyrthosiphon pisum TaxID=7029 RepID=A0A8R2H8T4_ACYPI|nr:uncharacterized protein LOC107885910 [Acyrthosiphon pisum]|eukprot:XP_016665170.1 PREDICTED: uncharacterized protein LOC107885910 [Acyrthosiphon pisum]